MLHQIFKIKREYEEAKQAAFENVVNNVESRNGKIIVCLLLLIIAFEWSFAIFSSVGLEKLYENFGFLPFSLPFLSSYFFFFIGSKLIIKPSEEELTDDTSIFAIFSACKRKSTRSFISIGLGVAHTLIFTFLLVNNDLKIL